MSTQPAFGQYVRQRRELLLAKNPRNFSLRAVAGRLDCQPAFLSMVERGVCGPPSEALTKKLAEILEEDPDVLLALAGKLSADLREIIIKRPRLFAELIRELRETPDQTIYRVVREVRDGNW
jgi:HTH-type transcriptional regulator, competence development regulator